MAIIQNEKHTIGDLFNNRNPFIIPQHQRAYSWESDEVKAFCEDLKNIQIGQEYFFGGVVSVHELARNVQGRIFRVVDGQQRLATFTMLIAQLHNGFKIIEELATDNTTIRDTASSLASELFNVYLTFNDTKRRPPVREHRLTLSQVDKNFFKNLINNLETTIGTESHKKIKEAWHLIDSELIKPVVESTTISVDDKLEQLKALTDKVLDQSVIIHIVCDDIDEAYQLFEVLNDRGRELATGDYLRSNTLEKLNNTDFQEEVATIWDDILGRKNAEKFLKSYLASYTAYIPKNNVHRIFYRTFFTKHNGQSDSEYQQGIKSRLQNIQHCFDIYEFIEDGIWPIDDSRMESWKKIV